MRKVRVKYSDSVRDWPSGWYVWVRGSLAWEAVEQLRFERKRDAEMALCALVAAGITTKRKLIESPEDTARIAFESLQW